MVCLLRTTPHGEDREFDVIGRTIDGSYSVTSVVGYGLLRVIMDSAEIRCFDDVVL